MSQCAFTRKEQLDVLKNLPLSEEGLKDILECMRNGDFDIATEEEKDDYAQALEDDENGVEEKEQSMDLSMTTLSRTVSVTPCSTPKSL